MYLDGNYPAIDLSNAASLRDITATITLDHAVRDIAIVLVRILETFPPDIELESCTIVVRRHVWLGLESHAAQEIDDEECHELVQGWAENFEDDLCPAFENVQVPCEFVAVRMIHPLRWNKDLCEGLKAIWSAGVPLRFENTTADGAVGVYIPSHE